jgi:hypothetical protein
VSENVGSETDELRPDINFPFRKRGGACGEWLRIADS